MDFEGVRACGKDLGECGGEEPDEESESDMEIMEEDEESEDEAEKPSISMR